MNQAKLMDETEIALINALIPEAVRQANKIAPAELKDESPLHWPDAYKNKWNRVYHESMDTLAVEAGLRSKLSPAQERTAKIGRLEKLFNI